MNLAAKSLSVLGRDFFLLFSNLATSIVIARTLGPEIMGIWIILNTVPSYAEMLGRTNVDLAAVYFLGKGNYQIGDISFSLNLIAIITGTLIIAVIMIFFDPLSVALLKENVHLYSNSLIIILLAIPLNLLYLNYMYLHIHDENVNAINSMILTRALSSSGSLLIGLLFFEFLISEMVICFILSYILGLSVGVYKITHQKRKGPIFNFALLRDLFEYAYKMYISGLLVNLNNYISNALIILSASPSQITFYALARQFCLMLEKITNSLNTFVFPMASKQNDNDASEFITKAFRVSIVIMLPTGILSLIGIYPAIYLFYGAEYLPIVSPFLLLMPGIVASSITGVVCTYFLSSGRPEIITKTLVIPVILQLCLGYLIIPAYGVNGAATLLSFSLIITSLTQIFLFLSYTKLNIRTSMLPRKNDLTTVSNFIRSTLKI